MEKLTQQLQKVQQRNDSFVKQVEDIETALNRSK